MASFKRSYVWIALAMGLQWGCSQDPESSATTQPANPSPPTADAEPASSGSKTERALAAIDKLAEAGNVDKAAAQLVQLRMKGTRFSKDEAAAYRDSLAYVYDLALDQQDTAKGKAALKILQANSAF